MLTLAGAGTGLGQVVGTTTLLATGLVVLAAGLVTSLPTGSVTGIVQSRDRRNLFARRLPAVRRALRRRRTAAAALTGIIVIALGAASQLYVPSLITSRLRAQLARVGSVRSISIGAPTPAVQMLWTGHPDSISVAMNTVNADRLQKHLPSGNPITTFGQIPQANIWIGELNFGQLQAHNLSVHKTGNQIHANVTVPPSGIVQLITHGQRPGTTLTADPQGNLHLTIPIPAGALPSALPIPGGVPHQLDMKISAQNGALVGAPSGALGAVMPAQRLFQNSSVSVNSLTARTAGNQLAISANLSLTGA